jgi:hypothetical protein
MAVDVKVLQDQLDLQQHALEQEAIDESLAAKDRGDKLPETPPAETKPETPPEGKIDPPKEKEGERDPKTGQFIPKARFDEMNRKKKAEIEALNTRLAQMSEQLQAKSGEDVGALETLLDDKMDAYNKLMADGDLTKAKELLREVNQINRRIAYLEITPVTNQQVAATTVANQLDNLVEFYKTEFPVFDEAAEGTFDQDMVNWVAERQGLFERAGMTSPAALQEAVTDAISRFGLVASSSGAAATPAAPVKAGDSRKAAAVAAAVKTAAATPARLDNVGMDSDKAGTSAIDPMQLSIGDLAKLPEATLKRLRGDLM